MNRPNTPQVVSSSVPPDYMADLVRLVDAPLDPPPVYSGLREEGPITRVSFWEGRGRAWLVTRYEDARAVLSSTSFTTDPDRGSPFALAEGLERASRGVLGMYDDPDHSIMRQALTRQFVIKRIDALRPGIQRRTDELLAAMTERSMPVDLVEHFALPLPSLVICDLLGVPYDKHDFFQEQAKILADTKTTGEENRLARARLSAFTLELLAVKRDAPGDDVISHLAAKVDEGVMTEQEAADLSAFLLFAGHATTANMIALGALALLRHPDQIARVLGEPAEVANAVEELLRYVSVVQVGLMRAAVEDVIIGDVTIRAGEAVLIQANVANRDPERFADPDQLDLQRANARQHLTFGYGIHQCLGQALARAELQIVLPALFRRLPNLQVAVPMEEIAFERTTTVYGTRELLVTW
jgi:cytochrome P450